MFKNLKIKIKNLFAGGRGLRPALLVRDNHGGGFDAWDAITLKWVTWAPTYGEAETTLKERGYTIVPDY